MGGENLTVRWWSLTVFVILHIANLYANMKGLYIWIAFRSLKLAATVLTMLSL